MPHHRTILVVEDEPDICQVTAEVLRDAGYRVVVVARHEEALAHLRTSRFGLILADPAGILADPWAGLEALREAAGTSPVIIYSAHAPATFAGCCERGFAGFLAKPFDLDELLAIVQLHLPTPSTGATMPFEPLTA